MISSHKSQWRLLGSLLVISITQVHDPDTQRPVADLSAATSNRWIRAFDSVILWAKEPERYPNPGVEGDKISIPEAVRQGQFAVRGTQLVIRLLPGATWRDVQAFIENVSMAFANRVTGD